MYVSHVSVTSTYILSHYSTPHDNHGLFDTFLHFHLIIVHNTWNFMLQTSDVHNYDIFLGFIPDLP